MAFPNPFTQKRLERQRVAEYIGMVVMIMFFMVGVSASLWLFAGVVFFDREIGDKLTYLALVMFPLSVVIMVWDKRLPERTPCETNWLKRML